VDCWPSRQRRREADKKDGEVPARDAVVGWLDRLGPAVDITADVLMPVFWRVPLARAIHVFRTPDRLVAGTVGSPGTEPFNLQAVHDTRVISVT